MISLNEFLVKNRIQKSDIEMHIFYDDHNNKIKEIEYEDSVFPDKIDKDEILSEIKKCANNDDEYSSFSYLRNLYTKFDKNIFPRYGRKLNVFKQMNMHFYQAAESILKNKNLVFYYIINYKQHLYAYIFVK